ncbi:type II secretion system F family protein [Acidaminococcus intestini]|nr:type II secretion system F family protein [Acidaminococcus intestini]
MKGTRQHFSDGERERLFKELGILLKSEIPILRALDIMGLRGNAKVAFLCRRIGEELKKGRSLSKALLRYEQAIGALAPVLLEAGEKAAGPPFCVCVYLIPIAANGSFGRK